MSGPLPGPGDPGYDYDIERGRRMAEDYDNRKRAPTVHIGQAMSIEDRPPDPAELTAKPDLDAFVAEMRGMAAAFSEKANALASMTDEVARKVQIQVEGNTVAAAVHAVSREVATRFDKELNARVAEEVRKQLPAAMRQHALVPLPDVQAAVDRALDAAVARKLTELIGVGQVVIGLK